VKAKSGLMRLRRDAVQVAEAVMVAVLWLLLSGQELGRGLVRRRATLAHRSRAQSTIEVLIAMAVLGVIGLGVWRLIGPAIMAKASGVVTDLNTAGSGTSGTGG
jgi:hypothetical protein